MLLRGRNRAEGHAPDRRSGKAQSRRAVLRVSTPAHEAALSVAGCCVFCYSLTVASVINLSYKLKLYPSRNKADTLALLTALFRKSHADATHLIEQGQGRCPSTKGLGEFIGRAYRRAYIDYRRTTKAGHTPGTLKAELIDSAEIQQPRKVRGFDCWIMLRGTTTSRGKNGGFYVPARRHRAINRTLALPGATLNESAEVFRKNGKWYARVSVSVPLAEVQEPKGWLGVDVGVRLSVIRSDGYRGRSLKPVVDGPNRTKRKRRRTKRRYARTFQRQILAREARKAVTVCLRSGRGISLENPERLPKWGGWAARQFAKRVELLSTLAGVAVRLLKPAYSSLTCSRCLSRDTFRKKTCFRCHACGFTRHADENAALNLASGFYAVTGVSHGLLSLAPSPSGGGADE